MMSVMPGYQFFLLSLLPAVAMYLWHLLLKSKIDPRRSALFLALYILFHLMGVFLMVYLFGMIFRLSHPS